MRDQKIAGVVLAGGQSSRMGGLTKAHQVLAGKPLLQHVIDRIRPQVTGLALSVRRFSEEFEPYGLAQYADPEPGDRGPLGGLLSAFWHLEESCEWLVLVPCDAPFLPLNLASRLHSHATEKGVPGCVARYAGELQPTFSLWHKCLRTALESAVLEQKIGGFKQFLECNPLGILDWETAGISPFFNINDPENLARARQMMAQY